MNPTCGYTFGSSLYACGLKTFHTAPLTEVTSGFGCVPGPAGFQLVISRSSDHWSGAAAGAGWPVGSWCASCCLQPCQIVAVRPPLAITHRRNVGHRKSRHGFVVTAGNATRLKDATAYLPHQRVNRRSEASQTFRNDPSPLDLQRWHRTRVRVRLAVQGQLAHRNPCHARLSFLAHSEGSL